MRIFACALYASKMGRRLLGLLCLAVLASTFADDAADSAVALKEHVQVEMRQESEAAEQAAPAAAEQHGDDHPPAVPKPEPEPVPMPPPIDDTVALGGDPAPDAEEDEDEPTGVVLLRRQNPRRAHLAAPLNPYEEAEPWAAAKHAEEEEAERNPVPEALAAPPRKGKGKGKKKPSAPAPATGDAGSGSPAGEDDGDASSFDDYYGLTTEPAYHLDTAAFQPSHTLEFVLGAGETLTLYEDIAPVDVGRVIRGDWFVTSGEDLSARVVVTAPDGTVPYAAGPANEEWDGVDPAKALLSEGSFRFIAARAGTHRVDIINPSAGVERGVAFAWLLGKDDDDPFVQPQERGAPPKAGSGTFSSGNPNGTATVVAGSAAASVAALKRHASLLHKRIDDLVSMMAYADVRYKRHLATVESTNARVTKYTLLETGIIAASVALSVWFVHRLKFRGSSSVSSRPAGFAGV